MDGILKGLLPCTFYAKMPVSQALDGIFGVSKGPIPSELDGPITGQQAHGHGAEINPPLSSKGVLGSQNRLKNWPK